MRPLSSAERIFPALAGFTLALAVHPLMLGCLSRRPPATAVPRDYPGMLVAPGTVPGDFLARQEVRVRRGETRIRFKSVLQKRGDSLTLLGLTPFGSRAFLLEQQGTETTFTTYVDRVLPFPDRYILLDIHRSLFIGVAPGPLADGEHVAHRDGEEIRERWKDGRLLERTFRRESGQPPGLITIGYEGWTRFGVPPRRLTLRNGWFGYELVITTQSLEALDPPS